MKEALDIKQVLDYKRLVASRLVPVEGGRIGELIPESSEYMFSEKLDGFLCLVVKKGKAIQFFDQSGSVLELPHLAKAFPAGATGTWAGELHVSEGRSRSYLVAAALAKDSKQLSLAIFDVVDPAIKSTAERIETVRKAFPATGVVRAVEFETADSRSTLIAQFNKITQAGGEGIVVHTPAGIGYKIKPLQTIDCVVLGYALRENKPQIRELLLGMATEKGFRVAGKVSTGFSEDDRTAWLKRLEKIKAESTCLEIAGNGLAFYWVRPEIVVEISCQEVVFENASGTIRKSVVEFDSTGYAATGTAPAFSFIHPVFVQDRSDKKVTAADCGLRQVGWTAEPIAATTAPADAGSATRLDRAVYVKEGKGGKAIRKFTIWKSDPSRSDGAPYVVYFTDFSAGRKDPLQTELYLASSEKNAKSKMQELVDENIKKGWEKVV